MELRKLRRLAAADWEAVWLKDQPLPRKRSAFDSKNFCSEESPSCEVVWASGSEAGKVDWDWWFAFQRQKENFRKSKMAQDREPGEFVPDGQGEMNDDPGILPQDGQNEGVQLPLGQNAGLQHQGAGEGLAEAQDEHVVAHNNENGGLAGEHAAQQARGEARELPRGNEGLRGNLPPFVHVNQPGVIRPPADFSRAASVSGPARVPPAQGPISYPQYFAPPFQPQFAPPRSVVLPKIDLPHFKGEKGTAAEVWIAHLTRYQRFYGLSDGQMVELARISCKGDYASVWASMLDDNLEFPEFLEMFRSEFVDENEEKLKRDLLDLKCTKSVGEYATEVLRLVKTLQIPPVKQVREFSKGLPWSFRNIIDSRKPNRLRKLFRL